jgi:hypothetical protein
MKSRESMSSINVEQTELQEQGADATNVEELFDIENAIDFKTNLNLFLRENRSSQESLEQLVQALQEFEDNVNSVIVDEKKGEKEQHSMKNLEEVHQLYEQTIKPRFRKKIPFIQFLYEYLHEVVKVFDNKYGQYLSEQERLEEVRQQQEERAKRREEDEEVQALVPGIREKLLSNIKSRSIDTGRRTAEHEAQLSKFETSVAYRGAHNSKEQKEMERNTKEEEVLLGAVIESRELFGDESRVFHTSKFDDYFTHADLVVSTKDGPLILIDLTYSQSDAGEKQYYNKEHPLRTLEYPPHPELAGRPGIPVVIGMTQEDARNTINSFLESEARKKIQGRVGEQSEVPQESIEKWVDYVLIQIERQRQNVWNYLEGVDDENLLDEYEPVLEEYEQAIKYFRELKKERSPSVKLDERRPWDERILYAESDMNDFAQREGKSSSPNPELPDFARAA